MVKNNLDISVEKCGIQKIIFKRPEKRNALDNSMIISITNILRKSAINPEVKALVFSGAGEYFSSGMDFLGFTNTSDSEDGYTGTKNDSTELDFDGTLKKSAQIFQDFVASFIDFPKPLIAIVNGPAVGIAVTLLPHFDLVFSSNLATFHCPFMSLGLVPEGCSSLLFPQLMGHGKAARMLLLGDKISAKEAYNMNLVTEVVDHKSLPYVWDRIRNLCDIPLNLLVKAKHIMKGRIIKQLHEVNEEECVLLVKQWKSEEFMQSLSKLMLKKSKL